MVGTRSIHREPQRFVTAGQHIVFDAKCGNREIVNHVLGGHDKFDGTADGQVHGVDLVLPPDMLRLPHPLLGDDVNLERRVRRLEKTHVKIRAPDEQPEEDQ